MGGIRFSVYGCQSENLFVCFGAKPTQRACTRDLPRDRKDEGRKVPETSWHERSVNRRTQSAEGRAEKTVDKDESRAEKRDEQKSERRLLRPVDLQKLG